MDEIKSKVLQDLIEKMDMSLVDKLKMKSPKFMKVETNDPEMASDVVEDVIEKPLEEDEMSDEKSDEERLMELYEQLR